MKTIILLLLLFPVFSGMKTSAQTSLTKEEQTRNEFQSIKKLVESNQFEIHIDRVYPQNGFDVSQFNPQGEIIISDSIAEGRLPFFGRAYSLPYDGKGGIEFKAPMKSHSIKITDKKKKKLVTYRFSVPGQNDLFQFSIDVTTNGYCSISLVSQNRSHINYSGTISPLKKEDLQKK